MISSQRSRHSAQMAGHSVKMAPFAGGAEPGAAGVELAAMPSTWWTCLPQKLQAILVGRGSHSGGACPGVVITGPNRAPGCGPELITVLASATQSLQMYTWEPAISFLAWVRPWPQKVQATWGAGR